MSSVLTVEQREQAGSDSYNRFEYQVHWIVCHIVIRQIKRCLFRQIKTGLSEHLTMG